MQSPKKMEQVYVKIVQQVILLSAVVTFGLLLFALVLLTQNLPGIGKATAIRPTAAMPAGQTETAAVAQIPPIASPNTDWWKAPDAATIPDNDLGRQIAYGKALIAQTAAFLGPRGSVQKMSNGMNCQNCHLDSGTKVLGNNYSAVAATYPKFRERSGAIEDIPKRINDCFERSLNGKTLANNSKEMQAMVAYITWLGIDVPKGIKPQGSGIAALPYLPRAANPDLGKDVYAQKCQTCHQPNGEGQLNADGKTYLYPPLWGKNSYNVGAGLFRLSRFAGYAKANMPLGATYEFPQLTDEEAWDVAAFVNSQTRPLKDLSKDWPKIAAKPIDHPFGPYADEFSEEQHKFGPFQPIADALKKKKETETAKKQ